MHGCLCQNRIRQKVRIRNDTMNTIIRFKIPNGSMLVRLDAVSAGVANKSPDEHYSIVKARKLLNLAAMYMDDENYAIAEEYFANAEDNKLKEAWSNAKSKANRRDYFYF